MSISLERKGLENGHVVRERETRIKSNTKIAKIHQMRKQRK